MASSEAQPVCTICLETTDELKVVTTCKHAFCRRCLQNHITSLAQPGDSFPCPTCHAVCPLPEGGVDDLPDYQDEDPVGEVPDTGANTCLSCQFTEGTAQDADSFCQECGNAYFCQKCTAIHHENEDTAKHVVISIKSLRKKIGTSCKTHGQPVNSFCERCNKPCCYICILLEHGNHGTKKIWDVFRSLVQDVRSFVDGQEKKSATLKKSVGLLKFLKGTPVTARKEALLQEIEDHAEECTEIILKQKAELKEKVQSDYQVVTEVLDWLDKVPTLEELERKVEKARDMLSVAEPRARDVERLHSTRQELVNLGLSKEIDTESYWESYGNLFNNPRYFTPSWEEFSLGRLEVKECTKKEITKRLQLLFTKDLEVDNGKKFVPCVAALRKEFYAVAHPTLKGKPSDAVDIYKIPGIFQQTITDRVNPVYDMATTTEGNLAVLSDGKEAGSCCVHLYCPENGYIKSTEDFPLQNPLSFAVNLRDEYVILCENGKRVTTVNDEGNTVDTHDVTAISDAFRIACCIDEIFVMGNKDMCNVTFGKKINYDYAQLSDLSIVGFRDRITCNHFNCNYYFYYFTGSSCSNLISHSQYRLGSTTKGLRAGARLSVFSNHIVSSQDHTVRVFKFEH